MPTITPNPDGSLSNDSIKTIEAELYKLIDEYANEEFKSNHREHLGASVIGEKCSRNLWYQFRWVKKPSFPPRMKRLFNRGHREEEQCAKVLTWMGFFVRTIDPDTNKQYNFSAVGGHYGGSGDSVVIAPWIPDENFRILVEYKTHNDNQFQKLKKDKLKISHPKHYAQLCAYGKAFKVRYGLYFAVNKDDDEAHFELLELDWNYGTQLENKASDIITSQVPLPKLSEQPSYYECKYCNFHGICHYNEPVEINCRSCKFAVPANKGEWFCSKWNDGIPADFIKKGCPSHVPITT